MSFSLGSGRTWSKMTTGEWVGDKVVGGWVGGKIVGVVRWWVGGCVVRLLVY